MGSGSSGKNRIAPNLNPNNVGSHQISSRGSSTEVAAADHCLCNGICVYIPLLNLIISKVAFL